MAKLMLIGDVATIEILTDPEDEEQVLAVCCAHDLEGERSIYARCDYIERFDSWSDAVCSAGPERHADRGTR